MSLADRQANLFGAFALVVADRTTTLAASSAGQSLSGAAALSAMRHFLDTPSLDQLRRVLGLTSSGTVRLVDRLADAGLVSRGPGTDGRSRSVALTAQGRQVADAISRARIESLRAIMSELSSDERATLDSLIARLMARVVDDKDGGAWICRLCDIKACERDSGHCPTASAAAAKYDTKR